MRAAGSAGPRVGPSGGGRDGGSGTTPRSNVAPTPTSPQNRTEDIAVLDRRAVPSRPSPSTGLFLAATGVERESDDDDVAQRFRSTGRRDFGEEGRPASGPGRRNWGSSLHGDVRELRSSCGAGDTGEDCPKDRAGANGRQRGQRDSRKISRRRSSWLVAADARGERKRKKTRTGKTTEGEGIATTMINYFKGAYNVNLLPRVHGSALYKGSIVGLLSVLIYLAIVLRWNERERNDGDDLDHPYGVGVLVTSVSFLIIFRANHSYQRYWEAVEALHGFMSKLMDATQQAAVFHLQSKHYDGARPPSFFDHDELNKLHLTRDRKRNRKRKDQHQPSSEPSPFERSSLDRSSPSGEWRLNSVYDCEKEKADTFTLQRSRSDSDDSGESLMSSPLGQTFFPKKPTHGRLPSSVLDGSWDVIPPARTRATAAMLRRAALNSEYFPSSQRPNQSFAYRSDDRAPPLFLQELAHLSSLACAVAFSTLRNDIDDSESPLGVYVPGSDLPRSDPDKLPPHIRLQFQHSFKFATILRSWVGWDRRPECRAKYNAARALPVLGGVSDGEIRFLQLARGPYAKAQLAMAWLEAFIIREHLAGSMGSVHGAIVSRLVQFASDAMLHYNEGRKIMYIPFPFPHAQLTAFFTVLMIVLVPFMIDQYTNAYWIGSLITFLTVTCLMGLHEVARELENPFRNVPNDIPLCTLQAMYNEALITMFSGYNPDSFWDAELYQGALEAIASGGTYRRGDSGGLGGGGGGSGRGPVTRTFSKGMGVTFGLGTVGESEVATSEESEGSGSRGQGANPYYLVPSDKPFIVPKLI